MTSSSASGFLSRWFVTTLSVMVAANVVKGISYDTVTGLLVASLLLGILNAVLRPILFLLSLPLLLLTFGLFILIINAALLYFVGWLVESFHVRDFWSAFWGGLVISIMSLVATALFGSGERREKRQATPGRKPPDGLGGSGPVIDV